MENLPAVRDEAVLAATDPELTAKQNESRLAILSQTTPKSAIKRRKGKGGRTFQYLPHGYVVQALNFAFIMKWSFEIIGSEMYFVPSVTADGRPYERPFEMEVTGRLTVYISGYEVKKEQIGKKVIEFMNDAPDVPVSLADAKKAAASDSLKKCATLLGLGIDMLDGGDASFTTPAGTEEIQTELPTTPEGVIEIALQMNILQTQLRQLIEFAFGVKIGLWDELSAETAQSTMRLLGSIMTVIKARFPDPDFPKFIDFCIEGGYALGSGKEVKISATYYDKT